MTDAQERHKKEFSDAWKEKLFPKGSTKAFDAKQTKTKAAGGTSSATSQPDASARTETFRFKN